MLATAPQTTQPDTQNPAATAETRFNGLNHGAASQEIFLPGENPAEFFQLLNDSFRYYKPANLVEAQLITDLTHARWIFNRRRRIHDEINQKFHAGKPLAENWTEADLNYLNRFDRYLTTAARTHQRALTNVRNMHRDNLRSSQWKQLHELQKRKYDLQLERFELTKAREKRAAEKQEIRQTQIANKALAEIRSAKNAVPSPSKTAPPPPRVAVSEPRAAASGPACTPKGAATPLTH